MSLNKPMGVRNREFWLGLWCLVGLLPTLPLVADAPEKTTVSAPASGSGTASGVREVVASPGVGGVPSSAPSSTGAAGSGSPERVLPKLEGRYWFAVVPLGVPSTWTVTLVLNGKTVGVYPISEQQIVEVTSQLRFGENSASVRFERPGTASMGLETDAIPPGDVQVVLAPGQVGGADESLTLDIPIFRIQRPARELPGTEEVLRFLLPPPWRTRTTP